MLMVISTAADLVPWSMPKFTTDAQVILWKGADWVWAPPGALDVYILPQTAFVIRRRGVGY